VRKAPHDHVLYSNRAQACKCCRDPSCFVFLTSLCEDIRLGQFRRALDDVERTLALCPSSGTEQMLPLSFGSLIYVCILLVKALIRKSKCMEELGDVPGALQAMQQAKQVASGGEFEAEINSNLAV
jgi:hypothetical protein